VHSVEPLQELARLLKFLLGQNFIPFLGMLAGVLMGLGYQKIQQHFGYCPMIVTTGSLSCGKTTSLLSALSVVGLQRSGKQHVLINKNHTCMDLCNTAVFSRSTLSFIFKKCCESTLPIGWDDPSDSTDLNQLLVDIFHKTTRGTARVEEQPQTTPIVTINDDKLKKTLR